MAINDVVLVVEDNAALRRALVRQLRGLKYQVLECDGATEAVEILQRESVALLFSDIKMSGLDGVELARQVRARWPLIEIVLASGDADARLDGSDETVRGVRFIQKPYRRDEVATLLQKALGE